MRIWNMLLGTAVMIGVIGATWMYAQQQRPAGTLSAQDYIEIQQLYYQYGHDVDPGSQYAASRLYTDDGSFESGGRVTAGREALDGFYEGLRERHAAGIRHVNASVVIAPDGEGARGSGYMLQVERRQESGPIEVTLFGSYSDRLVRTAEGWRFKERVFRADSWRDAPTAP